MKKKHQDQSNSNIALKTDTSPIIPQRSKLKTELRIKENFIFSEKQKEFIKLALDKNTKIIFVSGPAGSAKSYLSIYAALTLLNEHRVSDLIYVRSIVESASSKIGYLPGELESKISPYMEVLYDKMAELLSKNEIDMLLKENRVNTIPISFLRGLNWNAKVIIGDEAQNMTTHELITLITRVGEYSKMFILGDGMQSDINGKSGFLGLISKFDDDESKSQGIHVFKLTEEDIVRSKLVKYIVNKLNRSI